jgi:hypothetical protein
MQSKKAQKIFKKVGSFFKVLSLETAYMVFEGVLKF